MTPGDGRGRPVESGLVNPGADLKFTPTIPAGTDAWPAWLADALSKCPPDGLRWAALGWRAGLTDGCRRGYRAAERKSADDWHRVYLHVRATLAAPRHDDVRAAREARLEEPCPRRCIDRPGPACARCVACEAWRRRGGRPYLGVRDEAELAAGSQ